MELKLTKTVPSLGVGFPDGEGPSLNSYTGVTTAAGNVVGTTLVDAGLTSLPNKTGLLCWMTSGAARNQCRVIISHVGSTLTVDSAFAAQIAMGESYIILPIYIPLVGVVLDIHAPGVDVPDNILERDVIGNKGDTPVIVLGVQTSLMGYLKGALAGINWVVANVATTAQLAIATGGLALASVVGTLADAAVIVVGAGSTLMSYTKGILNQVNALITTIGTPITDANIQTDVQTALAVTQIFYAPYLQDTGDLEGAAKVITHTAENAAPDYTVGITLPVPSDARLVIDRIQACMNVHIDSFVTATHLYCSVYVGTDNDAAHRLFTAVDMTIAGADNFSAAAMNATLLALLADGANHNYFFHFWVNAITSATISVVELWIGIGGTQAAYNPKQSILHINHTGLITVGLQSRKLGAGAANMTLVAAANDLQGFNGLYNGPMNTDYSELSSFAIVAYNPFVGVFFCASPIDCMFVNSISVVLRK